MWSHEYHYYTRGICTQGYTQCTSITFKTIWKQQNQEGCPSNTNPRVEKDCQDSKSHICVYQIQHINTWILQQTQALLQSSETVKGSQEKCLHKEAKATEKVESVYYSWNKEGRKERKYKKINPTTVKDEEKNEKISHLINRNQRKLCLFFIFVRKEKVKIVDLHHIIARKENRALASLSEAATEDLRREIWCLLSILKTN